MGSHRHFRVEMNGIAPTPQRGEGCPLHHRPERDGLALAPPNGGGMETSRYRRAERDGIAPTPQSGEGWPQHRRLERYRRAEGIAWSRPSTAERRRREGWDRTDTTEWRGMAPAPQTGEGWSRPSTAERRRMETRAERDGIAPALQTNTAVWRGDRRPERDGLTLVPPNGERWKRPDTVEWRGMGSHRHRTERRWMGSHRHRTAEWRGMVSP